MADDNETNLNYRSPNYCSWRLQAEKRIIKGETNKDLEDCLKKCSGYNSNCPQYAPKKR